MPAIHDGIAVTGTSAPWLEQEVDWDAEVEADLEDLQRLVEPVVRTGTLVRRTFC